MFRLGLTPMMEIDVKRRWLLKAGALIPLAVVSGCGVSEGTKQPGFLTACTDNQGNHFVAKVHADGQQQFQIPVAQRVHDACYSSRLNCYYFFARRPGTQITVVDAQSGNWLETIESEPGHHFYGHGVLDLEQRYLFTTENHYAKPGAKGEGIIGIYELGSSQNAGLKRVGAFSSFGIGPHQLGLLSNGNLVVANGGLKTHPHSGRNVLNLPTMESNLSYIDSKTGALLERHVPPDSKMSIRHLAISGSDRVVFGVQYHGNTNRPVPLVGAHTLGRNVQWLPCSELDLLALRQYTASVSVNLSGRYALVSCPRGNRVTLWRFGNHGAGEYVSHLPIKDVAGLINVGEDQWVASTGYGEVIQLELQGDQLFRTQQARLPVRLDNHATLI